MDIVKVVSAAIGERFRGAQVHHAIDADKAFIRFHECTDIVLTPVGTKRISKLNGVHNDKAGITLLVAADLTSSYLVPPFTIDTGKFGSQLMKKWAHHQTSAVVSNPTHWMNQAMAIILLQWLTKVFPNKSIGWIGETTYQNFNVSIGLIWDRSSTHYGEEIAAWIQNHNSSSLSKFHVEHIPEGMTSIIQVSSK